MPTIIVDKARGLFQKAATSANKAGTLSGHKIQTKDCGTSAITLTESDSGKVFPRGQRGDAVWRGHGPSHDKGVAFLAAECHVHAKLTASIGLPAAVAKRKSRQQNFFGSVLL